MSTHKIYFVRSTDKYIKIGIVKKTSLKERRSAMQEGNPIILEWYGYLECSCDAPHQKCYEEDKLHKCFDGLRVNKEYNPDSEWFKADRKLVEYIQKLKYDGKLHSVKNEGKKFKVIDGF